MRSKQRRSVGNPEGLDIYQTNIVRYVVWVDGKCSSLRGQARLAEENAPAQSKGGKQRQADDRSEMFAR